MRNKLISILAGAAFSVAASGLAFAADMAVKAPPPAPAPVPNWTGFYGGIQFGGGWNDETVNNSANDFLSTFLFGLNGHFFANSTAVTSFGLSQSGPVGGFEAGYNWQASNWLLGVETDFSFSGMSGQASGGSSVAPPVTQSINAQQSTDWYGTVRGRLGWLVTPNLLLFGTGGFAYGRVSDSANWLYTGAGPINVSDTIVSVSCSPGVPCFAGSSSAIRTGWTAGAGPNGCLTSIGVRRSSINSSIWVAKQ